MYHIRVWLRAVESLPREKAPRIIEHAVCFMHDLRMFSPKITNLPKVVYFSYKFSARPNLPINNLCSLTGVCILQKYFTLRSIQIFKMLFQGCDSPRSDPLHKIVRYWFYFCTLLIRWLDLTKIAKRKFFVQGLHQLRKGKSAGLALTYFYMIHRVGRTY